MNQKNLVDSAEQDILARNKRSGRVFVAVLLVGGGLSVSGYMLGTDTPASIEIASNLMLAGVIIIALGIVVTTIFLIKNIVVARRASQAMFEESLDRLKKTTHKSASRETSDD